MSAPQTELTLLLVDDEPSNLELYSRILRHFNLLTARSGEEGLMLLAEHPIDVIITDQRMPGISGALLLERARTINPWVRRVILSGHIDAAQLLEAINRGQADRYLVKPITADVLLAEIEALASEYRAFLAEQARLIELEDQLSQLRRLERQRRERRGGDRRKGDRRAGQAKASALTVIEHEVARAVRYKRPVTVLIGAQRSASLDELKSCLREFDVVVADTDEVVVALPETDRRQAEVVRARLTAATGINFRSASVPEDGDALRALLAVAR